jgi:predicted DCC family thiol-disulfide oxidoreductase YuxK
VKEILAEAGNRRMSATLGPVLLYDGLCGFCDRTVQLVLRFERRDAMQFAALEGEFAREVLDRHAGLRDVDSLILVEPSADGMERVRVRSDAVLALARYLGGAWRALTIFRLVPRPLRDLAYDVFARHRYRVFGRYSACPIPPPEVRARFLA